MITWVDKQRTGVRERAGEEAVSSPQSGMKRFSTPSRESTSPRNLTGANGLGDVSGVDKEEGQLGREADEVRAGGEEGGNSGSFGRTTAG